MNDEISCQCFAVNLLQYQKRVVVPRRKAAADGCNSEDHRGAG
jgi:hypothetical protein